MMNRIFLSVAFTLVSTFPVATLAQDENVNCEQYLEMDSADQLAAIDAALTKSEERGSGRRFGPDVTDEEKLDYMQVSCTDPDGTVMADLIDMLGE